jgi:Xaa-Pro aminopeptidase
MRGGTPQGESMTTVSRRTFFGLTAAGAALAGSERSLADKAAAAELTSITRDAQAISTAEHGARLARVQGLMQQKKIAAFLVEAGPSLEYFTGVRWHRTERTTAALIPAEGRVVVVTPYFEEPSIRETLKVAADVRPWKEDESPFELLAGALREHAAGPLAVEPTTRLFIVDRMSKAAASAPAVIPGDELIRACRMYKSAAELALMQAANNVTIAALRHTHAHVEAGMSGPDILALMVGATQALGGAHEFTLVLLNEASAYPHGSIQPQQVRAGSVVLIDTGCSVHGYQSDITRTWVFGAASPRQRELWNTVKRGQELAQETAKLGVPVGTIDRTVRTFYEQKGWSRDYGLPGLSHRTGHGIGMEVHEAPYLVRNDTTPLEAGMCFSDEPGIYVPGEFGIRLEDCWYMTEKGPKLFTALARSLDEPV